MLDVEKLLKLFNSGLFAQIAITGTGSALMRFENELIRQLECKGNHIEELKLSTNTNFELSLAEPFNLVFVKGLEKMPVQDNQAYFMRTFLDTQQYNNLKAVIFCETKSYIKHFHDKDAPFYLFCLEYTLA